MECPSCGFSNLAGADVCEECELPLPDTPDKSEPTFVGKTHTLEDPISKAGIRPTITATRNTPVSEVINHMREKKIGCALIVEKKEVVGIFTERDVLHKLAKPELDPKEIEIGNFMTASPEVLKDSDTFANALNKMAMGNFRHVPIQKEDGSYAVLSVRDALRYFF